MKKIITTTCLACSLIASNFAQDAATILGKMDDVMYSSKDMTGKVKITLINKSGSKEQRAATVIQKGTHMRLFRFTEPASQEGIAILSLPNDVMYLYLPAFGKERRISSSVKNQKFAGTDFSYDDMESNEFSAKYTPKLISTNADNYSLELIPKSRSEYSKVLVEVDKTNFYPLTMIFYDRGGKHIKEAAYKFVKIAPYWSVEEISMKDLKKNHTSIMAFYDVVYDQNLADDEFTVRKLTQ